MRKSFVRVLQVLAASLLMMDPFRSLLAEPPPTGLATTAVNALGLELLQHTSKPDANALLSPYSIQSALAMAYAGADGATRQQMAEVLHYPSDEAALHESFAALRRVLEEVVRQNEQRSEQMRRYFTNDPLVLNVANRLFGQSGYDFRPVFLNLLKDTYAAPFEALDFKKSPALAARHINERVETQTRQRIRNLISATT